jgi:hypothetical protein
MVQWNVRSAVALAATAMLMASCSKSPVAPTGSVTVTTPAQLAPANGATFAALSQPITLTVSNAFVTDGSAAVVYTFEVSTDSTFASKVQTKTASPGNGQTSAPLDVLPAGQSYFWHVRATGGDTAGQFSATEKFTVGPAITLGAPGVVGPLTGATPSGWPTFTVNNSSKSGPVGPLTYKFEVSTSNTFATTLLSQTVSEGSNNQTAFTPPLSTLVPVGTTLFWRASSIDSQNGIVSSPSTTQSFVPFQLTQQARIAIQLGTTLWPGIQPPGTNGHAVLGDNWDPQTLVDHDGLVFQSPLIVELREFDLIDRGMDPQAAIDWMNQHGYPNEGLWVPSVQVVGYPAEYMALVSGHWDLILRAGG